MAKYSTGPIENTVSVPSQALTTLASWAQVKVENDTSTSQPVWIFVYAVGRQARTQIGFAFFDLAPGHGDFAFFDVSNVDEYEVEIVQTDGSVNGLLTSVWGKDTFGSEIPALRVLNSELTRRD